MVVWACSQRAFELSFGLYHRVLHSQTHKDRRLLKLCLNLNLKWPSCPLLIPTPDSNLNSTLSKQSRTALTVTTILAINFLLQWEQTSQALEMCACSAWTVMTRIVTKARAEIQILVLPDRRRFLSWKFTTLFRLKQ